MDKFLKIGNVNLSYRLEFPSDNDLKQKPLLVMIHGWNSNKNRKSYTSVSNIALVKGYAVLSMDLRGHGESSGDIKDCTVKSSSIEISKLSMYC